MGLYPWPQYSMDGFQHITVFSKVQSKESVMQNDAGTFIYKFSPKLFILLCTSMFIMCAEAVSYIQSLLTYEFFCIVPHRCKKGMSFF
jgi:hypothetical protein